MSCPVYKPGDEDLTVCRETEIVPSPYVIMCAGCREVVLEYSVDELLEKLPLLSNYGLRRRVHDAMLDHIWRRSKP